MAAGVRGGDEGSQSGGCAVRHRALARKRIVLVSPLRGARRGVADLGRGKPRVDRLRPDRFRALVPRGAHEAAVRARPVGRLESRERCLSGGGRSGGAALSRRSGVLRTVIADPRPRRRRRRAGRDRAGTRARRAPLRPSELVPGLRHGRTCLHGAWPDRACQRAGGGLPRLDRRCSHPTDQFRGEHSSHPRVCALGSRLRRSARRWAGFERCAVDPRRARVRARG